MTDADGGAGGVGDHHDVLAGPVESGWYDTWGAVGPDVGQSRGDGGVQQFLRQVGIEQSTVSLGWLIADAAYSSGRNIPVGHCGLSTSRVVDTNTGETSFRVRDDGRVVDPTSSETLFRVRDDGRVVDATAGETLYRPRG